ncbi:MAG: tripartite tricarboxylate transporter substrate binding protein [Spirochaetaceae bacterium]|nr:MAG: tripartite tricarboxylate transporter substrate binding protein [Spirochaetaceae bacterium]
MSKNGRNGQITTGLCAALAVLFALISAAEAVAAGTGEPQAYPSRAVNYVIPFDAGGQSDITAQYQREGLERALGVDVVIRHQPGAGGALAWSALARGSADGYTFSGNNIPHIIIQPLVRENAGYDTDDLRPVYMFQTTPIGLAVAANSRFNTLDELIAHARANPGQITVSGSGTHSGHHLAILQLQYLSDTEFTYIPATGAAPSVTNFLGGHTQAILANSDDLVQHRNAMKILAIGTTERFHALPDVPTFIERGYDFTAGIDRGVTVARDTPEEIVRTLEAAFDAVSRDRTFVAEMQALGFEIHQKGADEFSAYIERKKEEIITALTVLGEL